MQKLNFLSAERIGRLMLAFLLMLGVLLPLLMLFNLAAHVVSSLAIAVVLIALLTMWGVGSPWKIIVPAVLGGLLLLQFFLPNMGFIGSSIEAVNAVALYMSGVRVVMPIFGGQVALLLSVGLAAFAFLFTNRNVGFLPAACLIVVTLVGLWFLGEGGLVWYTMPALCALLLIVSQNAHEKISILNALPMALAVVILSLLLLPVNRLTIPPLEKAASELKKTIYSHLFFSGPRNVFTLSRYGYHPMGVGQLGGPAEPTEEPVMVAQTARKTLLRGVSKDEYTGRGFLDTSDARRYLYIDPRVTGTRARVLMEKLPPEPLRKLSTLLDDKAINVQMQNHAASTIFSPLFLRKMSTQSNMALYFNEAGELFTSRDLEADDRYTVFTPVFEGGDVGLDALVNAAGDADPAFDEIYTQYTRLPEHLERKVWDDAASMTENAATPYEEAMAIMRHLQKYYRYTLEPTAPPENVDFVTYFLYIGKEGYCTYYAASMTVLCRMAGLPARYVEGFLALPAGDGKAYITGKNGHAWTEVYFEGFGWVAFDPTPSQYDQEEKPPEQEPEPSPEPDENPQDQPPTPSPEPDDTPESSPPEQPPEDDDDEDPPPDDNPFPWWILAVLAAIGGLFLRIWMRMPDRVAAKETTEQNKIFVYGNAMNGILRFSKRAPEQGETPLRFARRIDETRTLPAPILPLWRAMAMSNYSGRSPSKEQTARARDIFTRNFQPLSIWAKLRFWLRIAVDGKYYRGLDTQLIHEEIPSKTRLPVPKSASKNKPTKVFGKISERIFPQKSGKKSEKPPQKAAQRTKKKKKSAAINQKPAVKRQTSEGKSEAEPRKGRRDTSRRS